MSADNWAHRSAGMKCSTCMWYAPKRGFDIVQKLDGGLERREVGRCRRHAPAPGGHGWPVMFPTDWCGDHKLDETKLEPVVEQTVAPVNVCAECGCLGQEHDDRCSRGKSGREYGESQVERALAHAEQTGTVSYRTCPDCGLVNDTSLPEAHHERCKFFQGKRTFKSSGGNGEAHPNMRCNECGSTPFHGLNCSRNPHRYGTKTVLPSEGVPA